MLEKLKKYGPILGFIGLFLLFFGYCQYLLAISSDEIWEYGYGYNIATGLIPYRDFNMVATPLYPYLVALFIKLFGSYLLSVIILNALLLAATIFIAYKLIGKYAIVLFPFLLFFPYPTYNNLALFLFVLFIYVKKIKISDERQLILKALILAALFLTKQSVGGVLFLVELFLTKDKKKYIFVFIAPIILLMGYLLMNGALYQFIDYAFLGLVDFGTRNGNVTIFMGITIFICLVLIILYRKYKKIDVLYALSYQTMAFPIFDMYHMHMGMIAFLLVLLMIYSDDLFNFVIYFGFIFFLAVAFILNRGESYIVKENSFMCGRRMYVNSGYYILINETSRIINTYGKLYDQVYNLTRYSYLVKLYRDEKITKFDMTLNGNMGYKGYLNYINDIDNYCSNHKCLLIISPEEEDNYAQKNREIIEYVMDNYELLTESYLGYWVYTN